MAHQKNIQPLVFDSNYFVALFSPDDSLHSQASGLVNLIVERSVIISNLIFAEIITVLSQKRGHDFALQVGDYLLDSSLIKITHLDHLHHQVAWKIFQSLRSKNISFVDCTTLAVMQAEEIDTLVTFDITDFKKLQKDYQFQIIS